mmetsp:Transcript_22708/g.37575  ORF Transcript_22708/g.37575 Transcript_22708/m.37575 type:complete len:329 (-) Transcript_22708:157-1143(-)|eukprot:CAMPEP_0119019992 /NCGR_PEP_ID=MMETSP1176-20130426/23099_1 /TAXON_ID=265551 /ORGANISM="Synedropsis recta cf, Strain CCMP1620" /LENGTH=328 /DNA_ID=CAMNT_0006974339 /DNA_START=53 /DNA_END=1039 /DNA_ORIENTATION=+
MSDGSSVSKESKSAPSEGVMKMLSPDGYYTYLGIEKPRPTEADPNPALDEDKIKKSYRKLSLRHHPDRPTGDADTFRVLNRAQQVLSNTKLRQQYDLLGLDLDDDEEHEGEAEGEEGQDGDGEQSSGSPESIMSQIASMTLGTIFQVIVRTVMMGVVAVILVRFKLTLIPALCFLVFVAYRVHSIAKANPAASYMDMMSPLMIGIGLILMHRGRTPEDPWSWTFWAGEILVMIMFLWNSVPQKTPIMAALTAVVSILLTLWLRGNPWKYATVLGLEVFVAIVAALAFPIMEMILEQILNEKMRRVGEKVRAHSERLESYYKKRETNVD